MRTSGAYCSRLSIIQDRVDRAQPLFRDESMNTSRAHPSPRAHDSRRFWRIGYVVTMGRLADQLFDILHEHASGRPRRFASARFRDEPSRIVRVRCGERLL